MSDNRKTNSLKFPTHYNHTHFMEKEQNENINADQYSDVARLQQENNKLRSSLKDYQKKYDSLLSSKERMEKMLKMQISELKGEGGKSQKYVTALEEDLEECKNNLNFLQGVLKNQIAGSIDSTEELMNELDKVEDPFAIVLINRIINTYNQRSNKSSFKSKYHSTGEDEASMYRALEDYQRKVKRLANDKKTLMDELSILKSQNDFLTNQLDYSQKKMNQEKRKARLYGTEVGIDKVYDIFGLSEGEDLIEGLERIQQAFAMIPELQRTIEAIFNIVVRDRVTPIQCDSNEQLIGIISTWSANLSDYNNLVLELFEIMQIENEDMKNRTDLIKSIKEVMENRQETGAQEEDRGKIMEEIRRLQKEGLSMSCFIDEAKEHLRIDNSYSNEAVLNKVLIFIKSNRNKEEESE